MRALVVAASVVLLATFLPTSVALLPGACPDGNATTSVNFAWAPACLAITSGDIVTIGNADTTLHNARSAGDDNAIARLLGPRCFETANLAQGASAQVRFTHDSNGVTASVRQANGAWGPVVDCDLAEEPATVLTNDAGIAFECGIHQSMTGRIVVRMLG